MITGIIGIYTKTETSLVELDYAPPDPSDLFMFYDQTTKENKKVKYSTIQSDLSLGPSLSSINNLNIPPYSLLYTNAQNTFDYSSLSDFGRNLLASDLNLSGNEIIYSTSATTFNKTNITSFGRSLFQTSSVNSLKSLLGLTIGTNVQAYSTSLNSISNLNIPSDNVLYTSGLNTFSYSPITSYARSTILTATNVSDLANAVGGVVGPSSSTLHAIARYIDTSGSEIENSSCTISDAGEISCTTLSVGGNTIDSSIVSSLSNIDNSISTTNWNRLAALNQNLLTTSTPTFAQLNLDGNIGMSNNKITDLAIPTVSTDAANKAYVDSVGVGNVDYFGIINLVTTSALPSLTGGTNTLTGSSNGILTVDGVPCISGYVILVKNQVTDTQNGIYSMTTPGTLSQAFVLTRFPGYTNGTVLSNRTRFFVSEGTKIYTEWIMNAHTVGTSPTITQITSNTTISPGNGLELVSAQYNVKTPGGVGNIYINGSNQVDINGTLSIDKGGSNASSYTTNKLLYYDGTSFVSSSITEGSLPTLLGTETLENKTISNINNTVSADAIYYKSGGDIANKVIIDNSPSSTGQSLQIYSLSPNKARWITPTIDINSVTSKTSPNGGDYLIVYDTTSSANRKITRTNFLNGITPSLPLGSASNPYIVSAQGGNYTTIQDCIDFLNISPTEGATVLIYPGTYTFTSLVLPNNTTILGLNNVVIDGYFTISSGVNVYIQNITFDVTHQNVSINCQGGNVNCKDIKFIGSNLNSFPLLINNSTISILRDINVKCSCNSVLYIYGTSNADVDSVYLLEGNCTSLLSLGTTGIINANKIKCIGGTLVSLVFIGIPGYVYLNEIESINDYSTNGIYVNGNCLSLVARNINLKCSSADIYVHSSSGTYYIEGVYYTEDINSSVDVIRIKKNENGVGIRANSYFGGADESNKIFTYTPSSYTVQTTNFTAFSNLTTSILYIGNNSQIQAIEIICSTALNLGSGSILFQYWNGSSYSTLKSLCVKDNVVSNRFPLGKSYIRFNNVNDWTTNTINSITKFWVKITILSAITTSPVITSIKCLDNLMKIDDNGRILRFGANEEYTYKDCSLSNVSACTLSTFQLSSSLIGASNYLFNSISSYIIFKIPPIPYLDSSRDITVYLRCYTVYSSNEDTLNIQLLYIKPTNYTSNFNIVSSSMTTNTVSSTVSTLQANTNLIQTISFTLDYSEIQDPYPVYFKIIRDSGSTYNGNFGILDCYFKSFSFF